MIRQQLDKLIAKVDAMSLRERALIFAAVVFLLISLVNTFMLAPLLLQQKKLSNQVVQQQEKMKEVRGQIEALIQAKSANETSPQRKHMSQLRQELEEGSAYLKSNQEKLVPPEKMADLLRQMLGKNANLQLMALQTLPVTPLLEKDSSKAEAVAVPATQVVLEKQIFKHGVEMTVRGNYLDLLQYLNSLEHMPTQMFWGKVHLAVGQYPAADLTLTLYTLSLDKTWLQI